MLLKRTPRRPLRSRASALPVAAAVALLATPLCVHATTDAPYFVRGDINGDTTRDLTDAVFLFSALFTDMGSRLPCEDSADVNDDGDLDISDGTWLLWFLFLGADAPPAPGGACGFDQTADELTCGRFGPCGQNDTVALGTLIQDLFAATSETADAVCISALEISDDTAALEALLQK